MKKVKSIRMVVKRVSYQEVLVNEEDHDVGDLNDPMNLVEVVEDMKCNSQDYVSHDDWDIGELTIESFDIQSEETAK